MTDLKPQFSGSVPEIYHQLLVPLLFAEYAVDLAGRVRAPKHGAILETACGTGVVTRQLRKALDTGVRLVATDLSAAMLAVAQDKLKDLGGIEFQTADAVSLPFDDASFDAVVCQFGVMFFPDKGKGYREALRVLKPGGSFLFSVWDSLSQNPIPACVSDTVAALTPDNPAGFLGAIPYGYYDKTSIEQTLLDSGFNNVEYFVLKKTSRAPTAHDASQAFTAGTPLAAQLEERGITESGSKAAELAMRERYGERDVSAPMQAIIFVATKPA